MLEESKEIYNRVFQLHKEGYSSDKIQTIHRKEGLQDTFLTEALCKLKLVIYKKRKGRGVTLMIAGGIILLTGFIMTVFLFHADHNFDIFMYGFTIIGTLILGYGAYEVLQ
jgi:uncharacterized membrane protein